MLRRLSTLALEAALVVNHSSPRHVKISSWRVWPASNDDTKKAICGPAPVIFAAYEIESVYDNRKGCLEGMTLGLYHPLYTRTYTFDSMKGHPTLRTSSKRVIDHRMKRITVAWSGRLSRSFFSSTPASCRVADGTEFCGCVGPC